MNANNNITVIPAGNLNHLCGEKMVFQLDKLDEKISCICRGCIFGKFLIIQPPEINHLDFIFSPDTTVIARYLIDGTVYGFKTYVIETIFRPHRLTFIGYPTELDLLNLRSYERVDVFIKAQLEIYDMKIPGVIIDLSCGGCLLSIKPEKQYLGLTLKGEGDALITFPIEHKTLTMPCRIVRIIEDDTKLQLGIHFKSETGKDYQLIKNYVNHVKNFYPS